MTSRRRRHLRAVRDGPDEKRLATDEDLAAEGLLPVHGPERGEPPPADVEVIYDGTILPPEGIEQDRPRLRHLAVETLITIGIGVHSWLARAWDGISLGVHRRQIRAAEQLGDQEMLVDWVERTARARADRHARLMDLPLLVVGLVKVALLGLAGVVGVLGLLSVAIWATGHGPLSGVFASVGVVVGWAIGVTALIWPLLLALLALGVVVGAWREGRRRSAAPSWLATAGEPDADIAIDETTIARALEALRIPQITAYLKDGLPIQYIVPCRTDGRGTRAVLRLPAGVTAEQIAKRRAALATGLYRAAKEVWPTTGDEAGILDLWVADKGALEGGAGPYPLLPGGICDVFRGVPLGVTLRGDPVIAPLIDRNTITGGMPAQGKSSAARALMAGAGLDPTAELRIYVPDSNFDFELFKRRCSRYIMGAENEYIEAIRDDLRDLHAEVQRRGDLLVQQQEPAVTRKLADAGIGLHPLIALLEEAHVAIQHPVYGAEISHLLIEIVKLGRKRGIHVIVSTQAPTKDSMPRDVTRNCSNGIAFAVGDHVANDALLGQGAYRSGIRATELLPGVDRGTAVCRGFTEGRADIIQIYLINIERGRDEVTPLIDRAMAAIEKRGRSLPGADRPALRGVAERDLLADVAEVLADRTDPVPVADLPALLSARAPGWAPYRSLTGKRLRELLADEGVKVPSTGNRYPVDPATVREAVARRGDGS